MIPLLSGERSRMMDSTTSRKPLLGQKSRLLASGLGLLFWLLVWELLARYVDLSVVLSPPKEVFLTLFRLMQTGAFWLTIASSFLRILTGFAAGLFLGVLFALLSFYSRIMDALIHPLMSVLKATPVASFIILLLFFSRNQFIPGIIVCIMVAPVIWANGLKGMKEADPALLEMADVFSLSKKWQLRHIYGPSLKAYLLPGFLTALGLSWKAGVAAEVLAAPPLSIGGMLYRAKVYLETPEMMAWTLCVILISMGLECLLKRLLLLTGENGRRPAP